MKDILHTEQETEPSGQRNAVQCKHSFILNCCIHVETEMCLLSNYIKIVNQVHMGKIIIIAY